MSDTALILSVLFSGLSIGVVIAVIKDSLDI